MLRIEHDHLRERVAPDAADDPLRIRVLPGTARGNLHLFDTEVFHP